MGAVPWQEVFNVWFAYDYRIDPATYEGLSAIGPWLGAAFAAVGVGFALHRRELALPLIVASGAIAAVVISLRYTIYLEAKGYAILAPALAIAAAAAVLGLLARPGAGRVVGAVGAVLLVEGVLAGAAFVYAGAWVTPKERFGEIDEIADRFRGQGPMLVDEREEWGTYLLRDVRPFDSWGYWPPVLGLRGGERVSAPASAHAGFRRLRLETTCRASRCCSSGRAPAAAVRRSTTGRSMRRRITASGSATARRPRSTYHWAPTATTTPRGSTAAAPQCGGCCAPAGDRAGRWSRRSRRAGAA